MTSRIEEMIRRVLEGKPSSAPNRPATLTSLHEEVYPLDSDFLKRYNSPFYGGNNPSVEPTDIKGVFYNRADGGLVVEFFSAALGAQEIGSVGISKPPCSIDELLPGRKNVIKHITDHGIPLTDDYYTLPPKGFRKQDEIWHVTIPHDHIPAAVEALKRMVALSEHDGSAPRVNEVIRRFRGALDQALEHHKSREERMPQASTVTVDQRERPASLSPRLDRSCERRL